MENKTRNINIILLSIAAIGVYFILKSKKAPTTINTNVILPSIDEGGEISEPVVVNEPIRLPDPIVEKPIPGRTTKDCRITYYSCTSGERHEMIEIPLNANCNDYQEVRPNCINEQLNKLFSDKKYTPQAQIERGYL
jgi:hypothetical protein